MDPDEQLEKSLKFQTISYLELTFSSNGDFYIKIQNIFDHPDNIDTLFQETHATHNIESCIVPLDHLSNPSPSKSLVCKCPELLYSSYSYLCIYTERNIEFVLHFRKIYRWYSILHVSTCFSVLLSCLRVQIYNSALNHLIETLLHSLQFSKVSVEKLDPILTFNLRPVVFFMETFRSFPLFLMFQNFPALELTVDSSLLGAEPFDLITNVLQL